ncbi:1-deoxy-D-xylulose-5-phosphate reductoisomerase [Rhodoferax ferrireducens]|uniref:1-deoxy-D-xylulose 5-phosphate reductoisomerase n=1 Tax=Rhodoferax ferrireducens TaxID=192843 RepID=A0ABU2C396_9BURK|nr:1-deoxy-D-xylulose-5-phosphate reductoisomerase [Rhodoferax ferrireducens]MDR7375805.1 1-deoxy-D-xylulose-5-phosphate reductoisomerase [Rhodoferax ferrireducens]
MKQVLTILGSTGSVGTSTLDVVARHPGRFEIFALTAATQVDLMLQQCAQFKPKFAVMASAPHAALLAEKIKQNSLPTQVLSAPEAIEMVASHTDVDAVMAAIVGAAGLAPCLAAARAGKRLLLANKEALVVGGEVFLAAVKQGGALLLPIDSEHSAVFQSLPEDPAVWPRRIEKIMLTSSGGPFRTRDPATLREVTPEQACAHPNFAMGRKISVDSATMMNKALEVIEAKYLFGVTPEQIEVVIHPQQIIHSMVQFHDASVMAQLGTPDMRVPIAYGLSWPERIESGTARLDFSQMAAMTFEVPDLQRFPCLQLAWESLRAPSGTCAVLNAANEVAVAAFLDRRIRFDQIHQINLATLEAVSPSKPQTLEDLLALDAQSRAAALQAMAGLRA